MSWPRVYGPSRSPRTEPSRPWLLQGGPAHADGSDVTATLPTWFDDDVVEPVSSGVDHVVLRLAGSRYAVCASDVAEVVPLTRTTRLPGVPGWIVGAANWRGHVLPIVDLRPLLALPVSPPPSSARVVVLSFDDVEVGLLAEAVTGLTEVPEGCSPAVFALSGDAANLIVGLVESGPGGPVSVLGTSALLALGARVGRPAR